jgi:hypothetical protein
MENNLCGWLSCVVCSLSLGNTSRQALWRRSQTVAIISTGPNEPLRCILKGLNSPDIRHACWVNLTAVVWHAIFSCMSYDERRKDFWDAWGSPKGLSFEAAMQQQSGQNSSGLGLPVVSLVVKGYSVINMKVWWRWNYEVKSTIAFTSLK